MAAHPSERLVARANCWLGKGVRALAAVRGMIVSAGVTPSPPPPYCATMAIRALIVVLSLAAVAFLVVEERGARAAADISASALASGAPKPGQVAAAERQLGTAERWNPDTDPRVDVGV